MREEITTAHVEEETLKYAFCSSCGTDDGLVELVDLDGIVGNLTRTAGVHPQVLEKALREALEEAESSFMTCRQCLGTQYNEEALGELIDR